MHMLWHCFLGAGTEVGKVVERVDDLVWEVMVSKNKRVKTCLYCIRKC